MADADIIPDSLTIFQATQVDWRITASPCVKRMPIGDNAENNTVRGTFRFDYDGTSMSWFEPDVDMSANNSVSNGTNATNAGCSELTSFKIVQDDLAFFKGIQDLGECCALCTEFAHPVNAALACGAYTVNASGCGLKVDSVGVQTDPGSNSGVPMVGSGSKAAAIMATKVPARLMRGETAEVIISATPSLYLNELNKEITKSFRLQWMADIAASGQTEGAFFSSTVENSLRFKVTLQGTNQMLSVLVANEYTFLDMFSAVGGLAVAVAGAIYTVINTVELAQEYAIEAIKDVKEARRLELIAFKQLQQMEKNAVEASKHLGTGIITSVGAMEHQLEHGVGAGVGAAAAAVNKLHGANLTRAELDEPVPYEGRIGRASSWTNQSDDLNYRRYSEVNAMAADEEAADEEAADGNVGAGVVGAKCSSVDGFSTIEINNGEDSGHQSPKLHRRSAKAKAKKEKEEVRAQAKKVLEETKKRQKSFRAATKIAPLSSDEHHLENLVFESNPVGSDALENRLDSLYPAYSSPHQRIGAIEVAINDRAGGNEWHLPEESSPAGPPVDMTELSGIAIIFSSAAASCAAASSEAGSEAREVECLSDV
jgi:hypothetical protein